MGKQSTTTTQETTPKATPEETEMNQLLLNRQRALDPAITQLQQQGLEASSRLFSGEELPGYLSSLGQGVSFGQLETPTQLDPSKYMLGEPQISNLVQRSIADITPGFQTQGLMDSGVRAELTAELAGDIRTDTAQQNLAIQQAIDQYNLENQTMAQRFNIETGMGQQQFNQGQLMQLLNQAYGGQAQVMGPIQQSSAQLSQALSGLRSTTTNQTQTNPFITGGQAAGAAGTIAMAVGI